MADELTVARLQERVARNLGWRRPSDWPGSMPITEVANEAGEWLVSTHDWNWLIRPPIYLALVTGQGYCTLPEDFTRFLAITSATNSSYGIRIETMAEVGRARARSLGREGYYVGAFGTNLPTTNGPKAAIQLALGPVPDESIAQAFVLTYKGGWITVDAASDHIVVPSFITAIYVRAVTAYVGGQEHEARGSVEDRLDRLVGSSLWQASVERDDTMQQDLGQMRNGVGYMSMSDDDDYPFRQHTGSVPIVVS